MQDIIHAVDKNRKLILDAEKFIWEHPETGYRENVTSEYMAKNFESLGYELTYAENITGFYTEIDTGKKGPKILILGELDSLICRAHPDADKATGAVHACGHNAQCASLLGIAAALKDQKVLDKLCGKIMLCAVPAEEMIELEYRGQLMKEGKIKYFGGKCEFLSRGYFDGVDIAFMIHHTTGQGQAIAGAVGILAKEIIYKGKSAHAGGAPWEGNNALYAANCGINAVNSIRETFCDSDLIRFHPIITEGGTVVNAIPEETRIETYIRGKSYQAILKSNKRINQALIGAALSLNNNIEIIEHPGYAPLTNDQNLLKVAKEAYEELFEGSEYPIHDVYSTGSTDMGDLSSIMPVIHPYIGGASGTSHGKDYRIADPELACVSNAKFQLMILTKLLENNAETAYKIIAEAHPPFPSKKAYLDYIDSLNSSGERITYLEDGTATVKL